MLIPVEARPLLKSVVLKDGFIIMPLFAIAAVAVRGGLMPQAKLAVSSLALLYLLVVIMKFMLLRKKLLSYLQLPHSEGSVVFLPSQAAKFITTKVQIDFMGQTSEYFLSAHNLKGGNLGEKMTAHIHHAGQTPKLVVSLDKKIMAVI